MGGIGPLGPIMAPPPPPIPLTGGPPLKGGKGDPGVGTKGGPEDPGLLGDWWPLMPPPPELGMGFDGEFGTQGPQGPPTPTPSPLNWAWWKLLGGMDGGGGGGGGPQLLGLPQLDG